VSGGEVVPPETVVAEPVAEPPKPAEEKPAPRKRKTGASLSLAALLSDDEPEIMPAATPDPAAAPQALPSDEEIAARWKDLAAQYGGVQPRLANALANATLQCREEDGRKVIGFSVTNEAQKKWIEERILRDLEDRFAKLTGCGRIRLEPSVVAEEEQGPRIYMPTEKAADLMSKNEEVRKLVVDLALDIK
jgi:hypothetical protein